MINNLVVLIPEIFLIISICIILMIGVFSKNSYNFIVKSTIAILILTIILILNSNDETVIKIFSESFVSSKYTIFSILGRILFRI